MNTTFILIYSFCFIRIFVPRISEKVRLPGLVVAWARGVCRLQEEGVAGVMDLVQSVEKLLTTDNYPVNRSSVLGLLLRQVFLSFDKLAFSEVSSLKQQLDHYYRAGRRELKKLLESEDECAGESFEMSLESEESKVEYKLPSFLPPEFSADNQDDDTEEAPVTCGVSRKQADLFLAQQASLLQTNERAALSPRDLQAEISRILAACPGLPEAHYLSYLNCLRVKEVAGAVHHLYRSQDDGTFSKLSQEDGSKSFRYAALNLASYHARMKHKEEAESAIREAITMAQEASDHTCLQHVLSHLHRVSEDQDKQRLMERCVTKCGELNLTYLTSLGLLSLASHLATSPGQRADVSQVLELAAKSDLINCQHSIAELQAASTMVKSSVWAVYGRPGLAATLAQLLLHQLGHQGESAALALVTIILWLDNQALAAKADAVMKTAETMFAGTSWSHVISEARDRVSVRRALARQDWAQAAATVDRLRSGGAADAGLLGAQLLLRQGRVAECRDKLQSVLAAAATSSEVRVRALVQLSDVFAMSGSAAVAVQQLVQAIHLAREQRLDLALHTAQLHLANCHLLLGHPAKALQLALASLPFILSHGGAEDCAKAWLLAAKCKIGDSKDQDEKERRVRMLEGTELVVKARERFSSVGDHAREQDCLYLLARLYHALQLTQERNMAASQYKKMEDLYPVKSRITVECLL